MNLDCIVKPVGLRTPPTRRDVTREKNMLQPILEVFEKYMQQRFRENLAKPYYCHASKLVRNLEIPDQSNIDLFIAYCQDDKIITDGRTGLFISALYDKLKQKVITYNHESPIHYLGYGLSSAKSIIVNGTVGSCFGKHSSGLIVINGKAGDNCGWLSKGLMIINGSAQDGCAWDIYGVAVITGNMEAISVCTSRGGVVIETLEEGVKYWEGTGDGTNRWHSRIIKNPRMDQYLQELIDLFRNTSLNIQELQKLKVPNVKSAIKKIKRLCENS